MGDSQNRLVILGPFNFCKQSKKKLMNKIYPILTALFGFLSLQGQVYVNINATGSNDGSTWANAYTDLSEAVQNAPSGSELWIASGKYTLNETLELIEAGLDLYGGFSGNETEVSQRTAAGSTVISGDVNGDDIEGDFDTNSSDNLLRVIYLVDSSPRIIDGLTIEGGRGDLTASDISRNGDGGGLFANATLDINKCVFRNNRNRWGGGLHLMHTESISGVYHVTNSRIENNLGIRFGGGIYAGYSGNFIQIDNCEFIGNSCRNAGGVYVGAAREQNDVFINDCRFFGNSAVNGGGLVVQSLALAQVTNTHFENNEAVQGGGASINRGGTATFINCTWDGNNAIEGEFGAVGGAVGVDVTAFPSFEGCQFTKNFAEDAGGAFGILNFGDGTNVINIDNCIFNNNSTGNWGGAIYNQDLTELNVTNSEFNENSAVEGGAIFVYGGTLLNIDKVTFNSNSATWGGAILSNWFDDDIKIKNSTFSSNSASNQGGAFYNFRGSPFGFNMCKFEGNESGGWGGAFYLLGFDSDNSGSVISSRFISNRSFGSAGAIYHENADLTIVNSEFFDNVASNFGVGNSISTNQSDTNQDYLKLYNNTFQEDASGLGAISQWGGSGVTSIVESQNNIFSGNGTHWVIEAGDGRFVSKGGNISSSDSMDEVLSDDSDLTSTDPEFVDVSSGNLSLSEGSPCIDSGVSEGAPEDDIMKVLRDAHPDRGAHEYDDNCAPDGANVILASGGMKYEACAGTVRFSMRNSSTSSLPYYYIITDTDNKILDYQAADNATLDLSEAPPGECRIWGFSSNRPFLIVPGISISDLNSGTCSEVSADYVSIIRLTKEVCNQPCHAPRNLRARTNGSRTSVWWSRVKDARYYEVRIVYEGSQFESVTRVSKNSIRLSKSDKTYSISVRAVCSVGLVSDYSDEVTVYAPVTNVGASALVPADLNDIMEQEKVSALVYPNPLQNELNILIDEVPGLGSVQIYDLMGALKLEKQVDLNQSVNIDISSLSDGMFLLNVRNENGQLYHQRIVKSTE